jgi:hypothetical protein
VNFRLWYRVLFATNSRADRKQPRLTMAWKNRGERPDSIVLRLPRGDLRDDGQRDVPRLKRSHAPALDRSERD